MLDYYEELEKLNKEYKTLLNSKEYKLGNLLIRNLVYLYKLDFRNIFKSIKDKRAKKKIFKNFYAPMERVSNFSLSKYRYLKESNEKIVVYSCVFNGYDKISEPVLKLPNIDYILFTDNRNIQNEIPTNSKWTVIEVSTEEFSSNPILANRYYKLNPHKSFENQYDYSIYIDGNIQIISDPNKIVATCNNRSGISMHAHRERNCLYQEAEVCKLLRRGNKNKISEQVKKYRSMGLPEHFGLMEANVICTNLSNQNSRNIFNTWWKEFMESESFRDQLSFPYAVWINGFSINEIACIDSNVYENPILRINNHAR